jgi:hypothetical protein
VDEVTGFEFLYMDMYHDLFDTARSSEDPSPEDVSAIMYARYSAPSLSSDEIALALPERGISERDDKTFWENCWSKISGFCSNAHVQAWTGTATQFSTAVAALILTVKANDKLSQSPRWACVYHGQDKLCVSWAAYHPTSMTQKQIDEVAEACAYGCAAKRQSCEARVDSVDVIQYYCVSD